MADASENSRIVRGFAGNRGSPVTGTGHACELKRLVGRWVDVARGTP